MVITDTLGGGESSTCGSRIHGAGRGVARISTAVESSVPCDQGANIQSRLHHTLVVSSEIMQQFILFHYIQFCNN